MKYECQGFHWKFSGISSWFIKCIKGKFQKEKWKRMAEEGI